MKVHKDPSSSTVLKRKAENNGDGSATKKAKPTSGYVSGTGRYRGTMREMPTNAFLKPRQNLPKQDTKNLNLNAGKTKVSRGVSDSSPCQIPWSNIVNLARHESTIQKPAQSGGARSHEGCQT